MKANLWPQRWLRPGHNLFRSLIPYGLWVLKIGDKKLGILFANNLQNTSTYKWNECLVNTEKQLQQLSGRHHFLCVKAIILNTIILFKGTFLNERF